MLMKANVGLIDRMIRFVIAIVFIIIGFTISPWWFIVAAVALFTGITGYCGAYSLFKINTCETKEKKAGSKKVEIKKVPTKAKKSGKKK